MADDTRSGGQPLVVAFGAAPADWTGSVAVVRHTDPADTAGLLCSAPGWIGLILWVAPGAEANLAAIDLIDVLARSGCDPPVLVVADPLIAPGSAAADVVAVARALVLSADAPAGEQQEALRRFLALPGSATRPLPPTPTRGRLWGAAVGAYLHDRGNALRRLCELARAGVSEDLARYVAEHGAVVCSRIAELDDRLARTADWYLGPERAPRVHLAAAAERVARLAQAPGAETAVALLCAEVELRRVLAPDTREDRPS